MQLQTAKKRIQDQERLLAQVAGKRDESGELEAELRVVNEHRAAMLAQVKLLEEKVEEETKKTIQAKEEEARLRRELESLGLGSLSDVTPFSEVKQVIESMQSAIKKEREEQEEKVAMKEVEQVVAQRSLSYEMIEASDVEPMSSQLSAAVRVARRNFQGLETTGHHLEPVAQDRVGFSTVTFKTPHLRVSMLRAEFVQNRDQLFGHKSDPGLICRMLRGGRSIGDKIATNWASSTNCPVWNCIEDIHEWEVGDDLEFVLLDHEFAEDEELGSVILPSEVMRRGGFKGQLHLGKDGKQLLTTVQVEVRILLEKHTEIRRFPSHISSGLRVMDDLLPVVVSVFSAHELPTRSGISSPYCVCVRRDDADHAFNTGVVRRSLDPTWNHIGETVRDWKQGEALRLKVFDAEDRQAPGAEDESWGEAKLPFEDFFPDGFSGRLPVSCDDAPGSLAGGAALYIQVERSRPS